MEFAGNSDYLSITMDILKGRQCQQDMRVVDIIKKRRDGIALTDDEISFS